MSAFAEVGAPAGGHPRGGGARTSSWQGTARPYFQTQYHLSHGVNVAMGLKTPGVINLFKSGFKEQGGFRFGWSKLMKYHGVASGHVHLRRAPERLQPHPGHRAVHRGGGHVFRWRHSSAWAISARSFPTCWKSWPSTRCPRPSPPDMTGHQYDEQVNQVRAYDGAAQVVQQRRRLQPVRLCAEFRLLHRQLSPGLAQVRCALCGTPPATAAFPRSAMHPARCAPRWADVPVRMTVSGGYPFSDRRCEIEVSVKQPVEFPLYLRVPFWARQPMVYPARRRNHAGARGRDHLRAPQVAHRRRGAAGAARRSRG